VICQGLANDASRWGILFLAVGNAGGHRILIRDGLKEGQDTMMTLIREDEPFEMREERDDGLVAGKGSVSARVGQNKVEIDAAALKHLVDTLRDKLQP